MNISDIVALAKAGFTAAQIAAMAQPAQPAVQTPAQHAVQTPAQPVVQTPAQPAVQTPAQPVVQTPTQPVVQTPAQPVVQTQYNDPIMAQLAALTAAINNNAIVNTNMPKPQTADEILAEIINPPAK